MAERSKAKQELVEKIAKKLFRLRFPRDTFSWETVGKDTRNECYGPAAQILALVKQAGYKSPEEAEISFRVGQASDVELIRDTYNKGYEKGRLAGIKEIVEWIIAHKHGYYAEPDGTLLSVTSARWTEEEWQAKLKEWGL